MTKTEAILIGRQPLTETSLIVFWCSPALGLIKTVAKGARQPKSPFAGKLDLFVTAEVAFAASRRSDLHVLREAMVTAHRFGLRESYLRVLAASYFVKLIESVAEKETPIPELHGLLERALDYLELQSPDIRAVLHFEREVARLLGIHFEGGGSPIQAIRQVYHSVPAQRQKVFEALKSGAHTATDG
jgi:DNA repair protein RecO (recombination protein O)